MELEWVALALGDVAWIGLAFVLGLLARTAGLPPLVGFLATGFVLGHLGFAGGEVLSKLADLGITILLFIVGLKLDLRTLIRPQVWAVTTLHSTLTTVIAGISIFWLAATGLPLFADLDLWTSMLVGFALSFSSTVFAVGALDRSGEAKSLHGVIAVGILVFQDLAAVIFLGASTGKLPSIWAPALLGLILLRPVLIRLLARIGTSELLILFGLAMALGGAELFELAGIKGDLGALAMGILLSGNRRTKTLAQSIFAFRDFFLVAFFLSIGLVGTLTWTAVIAGAVLVPFALLKAGLFVILLTRFRLRSRTALLTSLNLNSFSEFGLIVIGVGVTNGWLGADWLVVVAVTLSLSFVIASPLVAKDDTIYVTFRALLGRLQREPRLPDDDYMNTAAATIAIFGMGRVGTGAYDTMRINHGATVVGVDFEHAKVVQHCQSGRHVLHGDPSDADFWEKVDSDHRIELVMLALPNLNANLDALAQLRRIRFKGRITAIARHRDDIDPLTQSGATSVFNIYDEAGAGFASHTLAAAPDAPSSDR